MVFAAGLHSANCILADALAFASKDTFVTVLEKKTSVTVPISFISIHDV